MGLPNDLFYRQRKARLIKRILNARPDLTGDDFAICNYIHEGVIAFGRMQDAYYNHLKNMQQGDVATNYPARPKPDKLLLDALLFQAGRWFFGGRDLLERRIADNRVRELTDKVSQQQHTIFEQKTHIDRVTPQLAECIQQLEDLRREVRQSRDYIAQLQIGTLLEKRLN